jgi:hypothetical protein
VLDGLGYILSQELDSRVLPLLYRPQPDVDREIPLSEPLTSIRHSPIQWTGQPSRAMGSRQGSPGFIEH